MYTGLSPGDDSTKLDSTAALAVAICTGVFATTIQTQDFKDCEGDRRIGRQTFPIVFPEAARSTILPTLWIWSIGLSLLWEVDAGLTIPFIGLAILIGVRFFAKRDVPADQFSFYLYNVSIFNKLDKWSSHADQCYRIRFGCPWLIFSLESNGG